MSFSSKLLPLRSVALKFQLQATSAKAANVKTSQRRPTQREAILLERFKGHTAAVTSVLVTSDSGANAHGPEEYVASGTTDIHLKFTYTFKYTCPVIPLTFLCDAEHAKEFATSSLDKTIALWNLSVSLICSRICLIKYKFALAGAQSICLPPSLKLNLLVPSRISVSSLYMPNKMMVQLTSLDGESDHQQTAQKLRFQPKGAPIFSIVEEPPSVDSKRRQIFCGNAAKSIDTWELPNAHFEEKVVLNGHTGWVRALATNGRWLFRYLNEI